jgi:cysteine desulfurase
MKPVYLDHNATTPVDPEVVEAMLPYLSAHFGNASSVHSFGRDAKVALENAREQIAAVINCDPQELFFTSGGTESDNIAVFGTTNHLRGKKDHLIIGATEHPAVLEPAEFLHEKQGFAMDLLPVDGEGFASVADLEKLITDKTALVSVMHANNETGAISDIKALAAIARARGVLFHTDAVQSIGKAKVDVKDLDIDMLSLTGHKIYGAKGTGALFIRAGVKIAPLFYGGSHEKKRRPGTENVAGTVREADNARIVKLADYFIEEVSKRIPDIRLNSPRKNRIPQTVNVSFLGTEGESIILSLDIKGIAASSGSACTSGAVEPSHVLTAMGIAPVEAQGAVRFSMGRSTLTAMGIAPVEAQGAVRFSMGRSTTKEQLDYVLAELPPIIERLRELSPIYEKKN